MRSQETNGEKNWGGEGGGEESQLLCLNCDKIPAVTHVSINQTGLGNVDF